jgi:hypothetical protein
VRPLHPEQIARHLPRLERSARHPAYGRAAPTGMGNVSRHSLSVEVSSFVGRKQEVAELIRLLGSTPLLTLTGAGGGR